MTYKVTFKDKQGLIEGLSWEVQSIGPLTLIVKVNGANNPHHLECEGCEIVSPDPISSHTRNRYPVYQQNKKLRQYPYRIQKVVEVKEPAKA